MRRAMDKTKLKEHEKSPFEMRSAKGKKQMEPKKGKK